MHFLLMIALLGAVLNSAVNAAELDFSIHTDDVIQGRFSSDNESLLFTSELAENEIVLSFLINEQKLIKRLNISTREIKTESDGFEFSGAVIHVFESTEEGVRQYFSHEESLFPHEYTLLQYLGYFSRAPEGTFVTGDSKPGRR